MWWWQSQERAQGSEGGLAGKQSPTVSGSGGGGRFSHQFILRLDTWQLLLSSASGSGEVMAVLSRHQ